MKKGHTKKDLGSFTLTAPGEAPGKPFRILREFYIRLESGTAFRCWIYKDGKEYRICHESGMLLTPFHPKKSELIDDAIDFVSHSVTYATKIKGESWLSDQVANQKKHAECIYCPF